MHARKSVAAVVGIAALGLSTLTAAGTAGAATAAPCADGVLHAGTYGTVVVTGECAMEDGATITIRHDLIVAPGAVFDAQFHGVLHIEGNVVAQRGSMVGLGCTDAHPCTSDPQGSEDAPPPPVDRTGDSYRVDRNVVLNQVFDAAINGVHAGGNVVSSGGGPGYRMDPWIPFSIKDDSIGGNLVVTGLRTTWFGVIRTEVGGNVVLQDIKAADPDGNEVVSNTIGRNLVCHGMTPAPQLGDAVEGAPEGYGPNSVGGRALGQCAAIR
ncbi:MAG TPA: hypothetical protein VFS29_11765 [Motilibacteraceae bacterium]|nr:hypothetical protein [Motilibacteraceae bacterium]